MLKAKDTETKADDSICWQVQYSYVILPRQRQVKRLHVCIRMFHSREGGNPIGWNSFAKAPASQPLLVLNLLL